MSFSCICPCLILCPNSEKNLFFFVNQPFFWELQSKIMSKKDCHCFRFHYVNLTPIFLRKMGREVLLNIVGEKKVEKTK